MNLGCCTHGGRGKGAPLVMATPCHASLGLVAAV